MTLSLDVLTPLPPVERARRAVRELFPDGIGSWSASGTILGAGADMPLVSAADGQQFATWSDADASAMESLIAAAAEAGERWGATDPFERAKILRSVASIIDDHAEELALLESVTVGKPIRDCRGEAAKVAEMFGYYAGWADKLSG